VTDRARIIKKAFTCIVLIAPTVVDCGYAELDQLWQQQARYRWPEIRQASGVPGSASRDAHTGRRQLRENDKAKRGRINRADLREVLGRRSSAWRRPSGPTP
jgi:hypothetical protein